MKKMMFAAVMALACAAQADFTWSNWWGAPDLSNEAKRGCVLGFASDVDTVTGAQVSAIMSRAKKVTCGCQFAIGSTIRPFSPSNLSRIAIIIPATA